MVECKPDSNMIQLAFDGVMEETWFFFGTGRFLHNYFFLVALHMHLTSFESSFQTDSTPELQNVDLHRRGNIIGFPLIFFF